MANLTDQIKYLFKNKNFNPVRSLYSLTGIFKFLETKILIYLAAWKSIKRLSEKTHYLNRTCSTKKRIKIKVRVGNRNRTSIVAVLRIIVFCSVLELRNASVISEFTVASMRFNNSRHVSETVSNWFITAEAAFFLAAAPSTAIGSESRYTEWN